MKDSRPYLRSIIFEITQQCNHACLHCYNIWNPDTKQGPNTYPTGQLSPSATLELLGKALDETHCRHITLTGGEPLLRKDLPQILDLLRKREITSTIISNGHLLDEPTVIDLLDQGVGLFELPLLSHRRERHDQLSGCSGAFDAVLSAMAHIRYHRGQFVAVFVVTKLNLADLYDMIRLAFAFGARGIMLNRFNPGGRGREHLDKLFPTVSEIQQALDIAEAASEEFSLPISCSIPIQPCLIDTSQYEHLGFGFCAAGTDRAYYTLDPLGNLRPCNHTTTILGNLLEESFADLITPERISEFVTAAPKFCNPCKLRQTCQGGCKAAAQVCYGSLCSEEPFLYLNRDLAQPIH